MEVTEGILTKVDFGNDGFSVDCIVTKDGDRWCCLAGDNLQVGVAGFGFTPSESISQFKVNFRNNS